MLSNGNVEFLSDDMDLCGDVIQALAEYLGLEDLPSSCDFPEDLEKVEQLLTRADDLQSVRHHTPRED